ASLVTLRARLVHFRAPRGLPHEHALGGPACRLHVAGAHLAPLSLVAVEQLRAAPSLDRAGQLPRQVEGVPDPRVHAESTARDDQVRRVARDEDASFAVALGEQEVQLPLTAVDDLEVDVDAD